MRRREEGGEGGGDMADDSSRALEEVSRRLHSGVFCSKFDAMCLATVSVSGEPEEQPGAQQVAGGQVLRFTSEEAKPLQGLRGLSSEITGILHSAYIAEQGALGCVQQNIDQLELEKEQDACRLHEDCGTSKEEGLRVVKSGETREDGGSEWHHLPPADDDNDSDRDTSQVNASDQTQPQVVTSRYPSPAVQTSRRVLQARRDIHRKLQHMYDEVFEILVAKTRALERIDALFSDYVESIARLATASGIKYATERAEHIAQPYLTDLLAHRYLDSTQVPRINV